MIAEIREKENKDVRDLNGTRENLRHNEEMVKERKRDNERMREKKEREGRRRRNRQRKR